MAGGATSDNIEPITANIERLQEWLTEWSASA